MKKIYILLALLLCLPQPVTAQAGYDLAYPFEEGGTARIVRDLKWGLVDESLAETLPPRWDYLGELTENRRIIAQGSLYGFADADGKQVIAPVYAQAENFAEGLAAVKNEEGKWGYIDPAGTLVIPFDFDTADSFSGGLALVEKEGLFGYIDPAGNMAIAAAYPEAYPFAEGRACVKVGELYGYIDTGGSLVIPAAFELAFDFCEGAAVVKSGGYGLIDTAGTKLIPTVWEQLSAQVQGGFLKATQNGRLGLMDTAGNLLTPCVYTHIGDFAEGLCPVADENGWGYMNEAFALAIPKAWDHAGSFSGGFAPVEQEGLWGYIDTSGTLVTPLEYAACSRVAKGFAAVCLQDGSYSFITPKVFRSAFDGASLENALLLRIGQSVMKTAEAEVGLDAAPAIYEGHTLLPIRAVTEAIGGTVEWDAAEGKITLRRQSHVVILHIGETAAFTDGRISLLAVPPQIEKGRTLIPLRFAAEALGCDVHWEPETAEILIRY